MNKIVINSPNRKENLYCNGKITFLHSSIKFSSIKRYSEKGEVEESIEEEIPYSDVVEIKPLKT